MRFLEGSYDPGFPFINKVFSMNGSSYTILNIIFRDNGIYGFDIIENKLMLQSIEVKYEDIIDFL